MRKHANDGMAGEARLFTRFEVKSDLFLIAHGNLAEVSGLKSSCNEIFWDNVCERMAQGVSNGEQTMTR
jgi:hypothetical protein